jgi:lactate permease
VRAGGVGLLAALLIAWFGYGYGTSVLLELGVMRATAGALSKALFLALTILWIIFPTLCIHEMQVRTGGMEALQQAMGRISGDPHIMALLVAWFFLLFIEVAAGFGTAVALAAPVLMKRFGWTLRRAQATFPHCVVNCPCCIRGWAPHCGPAWMAGCVKRA